MQFQNLEVDKTMRIMGRENFSTSNLTWYFYKCPIRSCSKISFQQQMAIGIYEDTSWFRSQRRRQKYQVISTKAENGKERWFVEAQLPFYLHETLEMKHQLDASSNELQSSPRVSLLDMRPRYSLKSTKLVQMIKIFQLLPSQYSMDKKVKIGVFQLDEG